MHGSLVIAMHGQLDHATATQLRLAIIAARDGYATPNPLDPTATTLRDAVSLGALIINCPPYVRWPTMMYHSNAGPIARLLVPMNIDGSLAQL